MTALLRWRLVLGEAGDRDPRAHRAVARRPAMTWLRWRLALAGANLRAPSASSLGDPP
jgi:hypothetical protein